MSKYDDLVEYQCKSMSNKEKEAHLLEYLLEKDKYRSKLVIAEGNLIEKFFHDVVNMLAENYILGEYVQIPQNIYYKALENVKFDTSKLMEILEESIKIAAFFEFNLSIANN